MVTAFVVSVDSFCFLVLQDGDIKNGNIKKNSTIDHLLLTIDH